LPHSTGALAAALAFPAEVSAGNRGAWGRSQGLAFSNVIPAKRSASRDRDNVVFAVFFGLFRQISAHRSRIFATLRPG
ncbi:MAG: hypothetical protein RLN70_09440, partial [Rhodospirillaceae bacterium]